MLVEDYLILVEFLDLGVVVVIHLHLVAVVLERVNHLAYVISIGVCLLHRLLVLLRKGKRLFLNGRVVFLLDLK